jgi:hypothetical protein
VVNCLVGEVQIYFEDCKTRRDANGGYPYFQVLLDGPDMVTIAVCGLLYN